MFVFVFGPVRGELPTAALLSAAPLTASPPSRPPGPDCALTVPSTESFWVLPSVKPFGTSLARASHKAVVQEKVMWVVGGHTFNYSSFQMILK